MKKIIFVFVSMLLVITGCSLSNTPNAKLEELLGKYQSLDDSIIISPEVLAKDNNLDAFLEKDYSDIIKRQYQNMSYEIKNTKEDGDIATITTEIEVMDYKKIINNMTGEYSNEYHKRLINNLKNAHDKITYSIDFTLTKNEKGVWKVDNLSNEMNMKLLGIY